MQSHALTLDDCLKKTNASPAVCSVVQSLSAACADISDLLRRGALANILGDAGNTNVQGEAQKKLDVIANDTLLCALKANRHCAGVASEEMERSLPACDDGEILALFDPLDGSSNIDINMAVGTIFSLLPYRRQGQSARDDDFLQKGENQLAAGYALYGASTALALTFGQGVMLFSYDPKTRQFILTADDVRVDPDAQEYAVNASNYRHWQAPMRRYFDECNLGKNGARGKDFNMRWIAAMVGDAHRILVRGGVFSYPLDAKNEDKGGKLRLMYEANPIGFIIEQAGGAATDGVNRILQIDPTCIHQRTPVALGAKNEVDYIKALHLQEKADKSDK